MRTTLRVVPRPELSEPFEVEVVDWLVKDGCLIAVQEKNDLRVRTYMPLENLVKFEHVLPYAGGV